MSNISYLSIKTIIIHEIREYFKEFQFTIIAPLITTIIFVFIFSTLDTYYSLNSSKGIYLNFLIPGIIMTVVMQTSFNYILMSPITRIELFFSFMISSIFIGLCVGYINLCVLYFFSEFETINYFLLTYYLLLCILIFSSLGALTGFLSYSWDSQSTVSNFFIVPISFLSGSFFNINTIDSNYSFILKYNPIYYLVDGFRSSFYFDKQINLYSNIYILIIIFLIISSSLYIFNKGFRVIK